MTAESQIPLLDGVSVADPLPGFALGIPPILSNDRIVNIRVTGDADLPLAAWPAAAHVVATAIIADLGRFRWDPDDHAVVTGLAGKVTAMCVAHALGSSHPYNSLEAGSYVVGDPAAVVSYIRGGVPLSPSYPKGVPIPLAKADHRKSYREMYNAAGMIILRSSEHRLPGDVGKSGRAIVVPLEVMSQAGIGGLSRIAWFIGWFWGGLPLVGEIADGKYFVISQAGGLGAGRTFDRAPLIVPVS